MIRSLSEKLAIILYRWMEKAQDCWPMSGSGRQMVYYATIVSRKMVKIRIGIIVLVLRVLGSFSENFVVILY